MQEPMVPKEQPKPQPDTIDLEFQKAAAEVASSRAEEDLLKSGNTLLPKNALLQRYQKELEQEFATYRKRQEHGALVLNQSLEELAKTAPDLFSDTVVAGITLISGLSELIAENREKFASHLSTGGSLQEFAGVDDATMDTLYLAAKLLYEKSLFNDAADAFAFLCGLNPKKYVFWLGLGFSEFHCKHYQEAVNAFLVIKDATPEDPSLPLTLSSCYVELGLLYKALEALDFTLLAIEGKEEYSDWIDVVKQEKMRLTQIQHH